MYLTVLCKQHGCANCWSRFAIVSVPSVFNNFFSYFLVLYFSLISLLAQKIINNLKMVRYLCMIHTQYRMRHSDRLVVYKHFTTSTSERICTVASQNVRKTVLLVAHPKLDFGLFVLWTLVVPILWLIQLRLLQNIYRHVGTH